MGSGRDKRKKSKGKVPGQGELKTAKKTEKNDTKAERRAAKAVEVRNFGMQPSFSLTSHRFGPQSSCHGQMATISKLMPFL